jgi:hypothetical protein
MIYECPYNGCMSFNWEMTEAELFEHQKLAHQD